MHGVQPYFLLKRVSWSAQADGNSTGMGNPPGYCYKEQPEWSQYRESSFGHGTFDALNSTHALWSCAQPHHSTQQPFHVIPL